MLFGKVLNEMTREEVIEVVKVWTTRQGGGGFPTGLKWQFAFDSPGNQICGL